jgi:NB-ARC domain
MSPFKQLTTLLPRGRRRPLPSASVPVSQAPPNQPDPPSAAAVQLSATVAAQPATASSAADAQAHPSRSVTSTSSSASVSPAALPSTASPSAASSATPASPSGSNPSLESSEGAGPVDRDVYSPAFHVPEIPKGTHLDFSLDGHGIPTSMEGNLKAAVMGSEAREERIVAETCSATANRSIAAVGMGGLGKTCALKGIGHEDDVRHRYSGGVYYVSIGQDVTDEGIVRQVSDIVKAAGGKLAAPEIFLCNTAAEATRKAALWFAGRRCLFLCDDLWASSARASGFVADLNELVRHGDASCLLISTRHKEIASYASSVPVVFKAREPRSQEAIDMLRKHAGMDRAALRGMDETGSLELEYVLDKCAGLPLALAIAGQSIGKSVCNAGQTPSFSVCAYARNLRSARERLIYNRVDVGTVQYPDFTRVIESSLSAANASFSSSGKFSIADMHDALSMLQKQQWVPVTMLTRLWGLRNEDEATEVVTCMSEFSLVDKCDGSGVVGILLHDLVHDVCIARASREGGAGVWHRRLIDAYSEELLSVAEPLQPENMTTNALVPWWSDKLVDDGYVHANLARHFVYCGKGGVEELTTLLLDFRWTERQLAVSGVLQLRYDFELLRRAIAADQDAVHSDAADDVADGADLSTSLNLISGAVQLAWGNAHKNPRELAFQMHGRLFMRRSEMTAVEKNVSSVERHAERPCIWSIDPFLKQPGCPLLMSPSV